MPTPSLVTLPPESPERGSTDGTPASLTRVTVPELDAILGHQFKVLDDGFVRVIDYMGTDSAVVQAARVSYGAGTKRVSDDRGLIRYLMRHMHTTPFEMCELKLHVRAPMDVWRQWIRHRTASVNEYSTRYSVAIDAAQATAPADWRTQSQANRQGSGEHLSPVIGEELSAAEAELQQLARTVYERRLAVGVAREQARKDLPLSTYTEAYWKIDLHNLLQFLSNRMDQHAQQEIRVYAETIGREVVARWTPLVWEAFEDYRLNAVHLSSLERRVMSAIVSGDLAAAIALAAEAGVLKRRKDGMLGASRERAELEAKLAMFGLAVPWS
ncbi:MAG TPA: FAD-dependent thymidylate synthase [Chloroflexota bacterium]|nr:FAD-dependent thymidylate synthase [Chloroflexota bacterium]